MAIDKKIDYEIQGGVKNYRPSEMVTVPKIAKSSPSTPTAKLAYITPEEEKILVDLNLYGSLKGKPNRGPGGIPSLEGDFGGGFGSYQGGGDYSSAETGNASGFSGTGGGGGPELPPGVQRKPSKEAQDIRSAFIAAGGGRRVNPRFFDSRDRVSPAELARARAFNPAAFKAGRRGGIMDFFTGGGFLGNIIRGIGQRFGLGKRFNEPTYDMSRFNKLGLGGLDPFANLDIRDIYDRRKTDEEEDTDRPLRTSTFFDDISIDRLGSPNRFIRPLDKEGFEMDDVRTVIRNPNFSGDVNIPFGGTILEDEFPSTEIDYGNPRNDPRVVPEEMGLVGDRGIMSVARSDIDPQFQDMVRQVAMNEAQKKKALQEMEFGVAPEKIMPKLQQLDDTKFFMKTDDRITSNDLIKFYEDRGIKLSDEQKMKIIRAAGEDV